MSGLFPPTVVTFCFIFHARANVWYVFFSSFPKFYRAVISETTVTTAIANRLTHFAARNRRYFFRDRWWRWAVIQILFSGRITTARRGTNWTTACIKRLCQTLHSTLTSSVSYIVRVYERLCNFHSNQLRRNSGIEKKFVPCLVALFS